MGRPLRRLHRPAPDRRARSDEGLPVFAVSSRPRRDFIGGRGRGRATPSGKAQPASSSAWRAPTTVVRGETDLGPPARIPPWSLAGAADLGRRPRRRPPPRCDALAEQDRAGRLSNCRPTATPWSICRPPARRSPTASVKLFVEASNLTDDEAREHVSFLKDIAVHAGPLVPGRGDLQLLRPPIRRWGRAGGRICRLPWDRLEAPILGRQRGAVSSFRVSSMATPAAPESPITGTVLFYSTPEPLNPEKHGKLGLMRDGQALRLRPQGPHAPLTVTEFANAALSVPDHLRRRRQDRRWR